MYYIPRAGSLLRSRPYGTFEANPWNGNYYELDPEDSQDILGQPRVERSRGEAAARRAAEHLFLYDSATRAFIEQEMEDIKSLQSFVDAQDALPSQLPISQKKLMDKIYETLKPSASGNDNVVTEIAKILFTHQISRPSTYNLIANRLFLLGHRKPAMSVMESLLMSHESGLSTNTFKLGLKLSIANGNVPLFLKLSKRITRPSNEWKRLQQKFDSPDFNENDDEINLLVAEGFMKFDLPDNLTAFLGSKIPSDHNSLDAHTKDALACHHHLTMDLLTASIEAAYRWHDMQRADWTLSRAEEMFNPASPGTLQFLAVAKKLPSFSTRVEALIGKLDAKAQKRLERFDTRYPRGYARLKEP